MTFKGFENCSWNPRYYYKPKNKALEVLDNEGCVAIVTVNTDEELEDDEIMVKTYSEGEGNDEELKRLGIIEGDPVKFIRSGFVTIPVYKLTDEGRKLWES